MPPESPLSCCSPSREPLIQQKRGGKSHQRLRADSCEGAAALVSSNACKEKELLRVGFRSKKGKLGCSTKIRLQRGKRSSTCFCSTRVCRAQLD